MNIKLPVAKTVDILLDFFFQPQCISCERCGSYLCRFCKKYFFEYQKEKICHVCGRIVYTPLSSVHQYCRHKTHLKRVDSCVRYNETAKKMIREIKYNGYYKLVDNLVDVMISTLDIDFINGAILVPVPLHKAKKQVRGFNQTELICQSLRNKINNYCHFEILNLLERNKNTKTQVGMDKSERGQNLIGAFRINNNVDLPLLNQKIVLVDDVFTTGTTLEQCAKVLKIAGFDDVNGLVFARD